MWTVLYHRDNAWHLAGHFGPEDSLRHAVSLADGNPNIVLRLNEAQMRVLLEKSRSGMDFSRLNAPEVLAYLENDVPSWAQTAEQLALHRLFAAAATRTF